jgi:hypothetical protein
MADRPPPDGPPPDGGKSLADAARAKRAEAELRGSREAERTTLNVNDPSDHAGTATPPDALGEALVKRGLLSRHKLFNALNESYRQGCTLRQALVDMGYITEEKLKEEGL